MDGDTPARKVLTTHNVQQSGPGMKTKWVFTITYDNNLNIKYKARLVVCGYSQIKFKEYNETYAPTASIMILNLLLHIAASKQMHIGSFDVSGAYLEADNDYINYAWLDKAIFGKRIRVLVSKALYGEKQAGKLWNDHFNNILIKMGFERCPVVPCLYHMSNNGNTIYILIHVDDGLFCSTDPTLLPIFIKEANTYLKNVTYTEKVIKFLGIEIDYEQRASTIKTNLNTYIKENIPSSEKEETIPMSVTHDLNLALPNPNNESLLTILGKLRYVTDRCNWGIASAVGQVSSGGAKNPSDLHKLTAQKIADHLHTNIKLNINNFLLLGGLGKLCLFAFVDASYITSNRSKSRIGGTFFAGYNSGAFYSFSRLLKLIAQSACNAELMALDEIVRYSQHFRVILNFLKCCDISEPTKIYIDNKSAIELCKLLKITHKTSAINVKINFIRQCINNKEIELHFIESKHNVADLLTKALCLALFLIHNNYIHNGFNGIEDMQQLNTNHIVNYIIHEDYETEISTHTDQQIANYTNETLNLQIKKGLRARNFF